MSGSLAVLRDGADLLARCAALTGAIATGKSTVARVLQELGARIVDTDRIARQVVEPGSPALAAIAESFGTSVIKDDGSLNREAMRSLIIRDCRAKDRLNDITHPHVADRVITQVAGHLKSAPVVPVIVDVPLLFEVGWDRYFAAIIVVYAPREIQIARLMARDALDRSTAEATVAAQMPIEDKRRRGTYLVDNSGTPEETRRQVVELYSRLCTRLGP